MEKETKEKIENELRGEDFLSGDYLQSVNPRREKFAKLHGEDTSSDSCNSTTKLKSEPSEKTSKTQKK